MDGKYIDTIYISTPLSIDERLKLLQDFWTEAYLRGIDKGTLLERDTQAKLKNVKERKLRTEFHKVLELIHDDIALGVKRHKRKKYKGLYPKKKKKKSTSKNVPTIAVSIDKTNSSSLPAWLQL